MVLRDSIIRRNAALSILSVPLQPMHEVVIRPHRARRSSEQNDKLHALLRDIARQFKHHGEVLTVEDWKALFTAAYCGQKVVPSLDGGGFVVLSRHTSRMPVAECSDLIELITAWGVEHGARISVGLMTLLRIFSSVVLVNALALFICRDTRFFGRSSSAAVSLSCETGASTTTGIGRWG
jgi:hypothetical protein